MNTTHGLSGTPEYIAWNDMRQRCNNSNNGCYQYYGGRGITVDSCWDTFQQFIDDMGPRPSSQHSLERVDNNLGYCPSNCVWATKPEQINNRRQWFQPPKSPMRYIRQLPGQSIWRVCMTLVKGHRPTFYFKTLDEALEFRANTEMEREMHQRLGFYLRQAGSKGVAV